MSESENYIDVRNIFKIMVEKFPEFEIVIKNLSLQLEERLGQDFWNPWDVLEFLNNLVEDKESESLEKIMQALIAVNFPDDQETRSRLKELLSEIDNIIEEAQDKFDLNLYKDEPWVQDLTIAAIQGIHKKTDFMKKATKELKKRKKEKKNHKK